MIRAEPFAPNRQRDRELPRVRRFDVREVSLLPNLGELAHERINLAALRRVDEDRAAVTGEGIGRRETELDLFGWEGGAVSCAMKSRRSLSHRSGRSPHRC